MSRLLKVACLSLIAIAVVASGALAKPYTAEFTTSSTGLAYTEPLAPTGTVVPGSPASWGKIGLREFRGFYDFDTSSLEVPGFPQVVKVEFFYGSGYVAVAPPVPDSFDAGLNIGTFMANGLSWADWNAGKHAADYSWSNAPSNTWIDLGQDAINMFYEIGPDYIGFVPPEHFSVSIRNTGQGDFIAQTRHCKLRVSYYPGSAKAMEENSSFGSVKALYR